MKRVKSLCAASPPLPFAASVTNVKLSPPSRHIVSWSVTAIRRMPLSWRHCQNALSRARSNAACDRQTRVPVSALWGEGGFGISGRTSAKSSDSVITTRSRSGLYVPSVFGR